MEDDDNSNSFDKTYFENGIHAGVSGYENYRWIAETTFPAVYDMINCLDIKLEDKILDFGCAKGFYVKALNLLGHDAYGCDISKYAISRTDPEVRDRCKLINNTSLPFDFDFDLIYSKDVFEHLTTEQAFICAKQFIEKSDKAFIVVPLGENGKYRIENYENDVTHIIREDENWWTNLFEKSGWKIDKFSYSMSKLKKHWLIEHPKGNGFYTLTKK